MTDFLTAVAFVMIVGGFAMAVIFLLDERRRFWGHVIEDTGREGRQLDRARALYVDGEIDVEEYERLVATVLAWDAGATVHNALVATNDFQLVGGCGMIVATPFEKLAAPAGGVEGSVRQSAMVTAGPNRTDSIGDTG